MERVLSNLLEQFKHRSVRDLAWVIASPPLVSGFIDEVHWWSHEDCLTEFNDCIAELKKLDADPTPLREHLVDLKNKKLGSVFEGLISFWLNISPNYQEKIHGLQIIEEKHTYGEIDFIIEELSTGKIIHLEVAVKFYLGTEPYTTAYRWFGTTTFDQLGKKIDHLRVQQTQLSKRHPEQLKKYFDKPINERHCIVKGRLFYPYNCTTSPQDLNLTDNHLRGRWCHVSERDKSNKVININKSHWLSEFNSKDIFESKFTSEESIETIDRPECYVETVSHEGIENENTRLFFLPDTFEFPK